MAVNLLSNVEREIDQRTVSSLHCWLDSTVALYWINGQGEYRQFVANRVAKIQSHTRVEWHHVTTKQNPADVGSRGGNIVGNDLGRTGPEWLKDPTKWPPKQVLAATREVEEEKRLSKNLQALTLQQQVVADLFDELLKKFSLRKVLNVSAWVNRFVKNCKVSCENRETGPLMSSEVEDRELWWTKRAQREAKEDPEFEDVQLQLNIQLNVNGVLECRGRIEGDYPVYLPRNSLLVVERARLATLHGGVAMSMAKVRDRFWIPKLRRLVKQARNACYGCARLFRVDFKIALLVYKALNGSALSYISALLSPKLASKYDLRSHDQDLLQVPATKLKTVGDRAFTSAAPRIWNTLPLEIRQSENVSIFKKQLKTFLFKNAFNI